MLMHSPIPVSLYRTAAAASLSLVLVSRKERQGVSELLRTSLIAPTHVDSPPADLLPHSMYVEDLGTDM